jgi:raffinose/stachyose/melibiose transport system permease protein
LRTSDRWIVSIAVLVAVLHAVPFYILLTTSFKAIDDPSSKWIMPGYFYIENFVNAWHQAKLGNAIMNNVIVTVLSVVLVIILGSIAAYPLSRYKTALNKAMYALFISALIVPPLTILVPLYKLYVDIGAMNTLWGIVLLHVTFNLPITIFLYTGFISTIPRELDEAAMIDGSSRMGLFFRIILPLMQPATATIVILTGVAVWNDYQFSVFFLQRTEVHTITVSLAAFFGQYNNNVGWVAAGSLIAALPIATMYLFLQKYFIQGMTAGAIKA